VGGIVWMDVRFPERFREVRYVLQSKYEELRYLNYNSITVKKIWEFCVEKKWRKKDVQQMPLHQLVSDIFRISGSEIISYIQISDQQQMQGSFAPINLDEVEMLIGRKTTKNEEIANDFSDSI